MSKPQMSVPHLLAVLAALCLGGCGGRPLLVADSGPALPDRGGTTNPTPSPVPEPGPGPQACTANSDCPAGWFCALGSDCGRDNPEGRCQPRGKAELCPEWAHCPTVCGCDGKTYCDECEAHAGGTSVAYGGRCCEDIEASYQSALAQARACCAACDEMTCTVQVPSSLVCTGCPTFVSFENGQALQAMQAAAREWADQYCNDRFQCPLYANDPCVPYATGATCVPGTGGGRCQDLRLH